MRQEDSKSRLSFLFGRAQSVGSRTYPDFTRAVTVLGVDAYGSPWTALDGPGQSESKSYPRACPETQARWKATGPGWQSHVVNIKRNPLPIGLIAGTGRIVTFDVCRRSYRLAHCRQGRAG